MNQAEKTEFHGSAIQRLHQIVAAVVHIVPALHHLGPQVDALTTEFSEKFAPEATPAAPPAPEPQTKPDERQHDRHHRR